MNKRSLLTFIITALYASGSAYAAERSVTLAVENMTCASCPYIVQESLKAVPGVKTVEVSLEAYSATVVYDDAATSPEVLTKATTDAGYPSKVKS